MATAKVTQFKKGMTPWNKGKTGVQPSTRKGKKGRKHTDVEKKAVSLKMSKEKHHNWKGGISKITNYNIKDRISIMEILGLMCCKCGYTDLRALQIDHINGNGHEERRKRGTESYYRFMLNKVIAGSKEYQVLRANCNWIKRLENNEGTNKISL